MATIFDKILSGEIPSYKVWEDDKHFAFLDVNPRCEGHTLVIPKRPVDAIFDMESAAYSELWLAAQKVAKLLQAKFKCQRVCIGAWGFEVRHAHIHLFPANAISDAAPPPVNEAAKAKLATTHQLFTS